jgi:hypothetical protein
VSSRRYRRWQSDHHRSRATQRESHVEQTLLYVLEKKETRAPVPTDAGKAKLEPPWSRGSRAMSTWRLDIWLSL